MTPAFPFQAVRRLAISVFAALALPAWAQVVDVAQPWARATVAGQSGTGAFMSLVARRDVTLVAVSSPVAEVAEVHEMKMEGDVMRMRAVAGGLPLPAGKPVLLAPGGYHLMLMKLRTALPKDSTVPLTLTFRDAAGKELRQELAIPVLVAAPTAASTAAPAPAGAAAAHKH